MPVSSFHHRGTLNRIWRIGTFPAIGKFKHGRIMSVTNLLVYIKREPGTTSAWQWTSLSDQPMAAFTHFLEISRIMDGRL